MTNILTGVLLIGLTLLSINQTTTVPKVSALEAAPVETLTLPQPIETKTEFHEKLITEATTVEKPVQTKDDPDQEIGEETVLDQGSDGKLTKVIRVTYHLDEEYDRELISSETVAPQPKVVSRGSKIVWRILDTPDGPISYWRKIRVWATHYDSHCLGCDDWTAIGMHQGKGVIAVDPKVIKLRSSVYIPGYGKAIAGDTGGAIKGNIIDLGFEDARTAGWHAQFVDIYLIN